MGFGSGLFGRLSLTLCLQPCLGASWGHDPLTKSHPESAGQPEFMWKLTWRCLSTIRSVLLCILWSVFLSCPRPEGSSRVSWVINVLFYTQGTKGTSKISGDGLVTLIVQFCFLSPQTILSTISFVQSVFWVLCKMINFGFYFIFSSNAHKRNKRVYPKKHL